jgi:CubicO group peptidase (beta-lactamase class C family)
MNARCIARFVIGVVVVVGTATNVATAQRAANAARTSPDFAAFDKYVAQAARDWKTPGMAIAIVQGDSLVFARGYGLREVGTTNRVDEHSRFAIGSTTKAMTTMGLAMLVEEGKLRFDDRIVDHIPEFQLSDPWVTREVTVRDLLLHRTGLPGTDAMWTRFAFSPTEMLRRVRYIKPTASFRTEWQYQNVMYGVAGTLLERVSGMKWADFLRTRIFAPLGMGETEPLVAGILSKPNVAFPHALRNDTARVTRLGNTDSIAPAGSVWSSVSDMSKWMRFILDSGRVGSKRLVSAATFREIVTPQIRAPMDEYPALELSRPNAFSYGLSWFIQDYRGQTVWMHTGSISGMSAIIGLLPEKHMGVYILLNLDHVELRHALMYQAFDLYIGGPSRDWSGDLRAAFIRSAAAAGGRGGNVNAAAAGAPVPPSLPLNRYAGTFVDSAYGTIRVTFADGKLRAQLEGEPEAELEPAGNERFRTRPTSPNQAPTVYTFDPDGAGNVTGVRLAGNMLFSRVAAARR